MATTTTNYGFDIPQSTDLVKDGATAIATLGQDIDTAMNTALGTKKAGMVLLNTTSFSGVASQTAPASTFTSTYRNYRIIFSNLTTSVNATNLRLRLRASGSDTTSNTYYRFGTIDGPPGNFGTGYEQNTSWFAGNNSSSSVSFITIDLINPQLATRTGIDMHYLSPGNNLFFMVAGYQSDTTQFDSFNLYPDTGNVSGTMQIFAYNQ
jgi:hypothetical protein